MQRKLSALTAVVMVGLVVGPAVADLTVTVGPSTEPWLGYMNVFELPANGGGYVFGSPWGIADLAATFDDPNNEATFLATPITNENDPFWWVDGVSGPGAEGNKNMEANLYQEFPAGALAGETLTFEGVVVSNTLTEHQATIFIKDFAPDYSSSNSTIIPAVPGPFSISLALDPGAGRHVQYGFANFGVNVWPSDLPSFGSVVYGIPEPGTLALLAIGGLALLRRR